MAYVVVMVHRMRCLCRLFVRVLLFQRVTASTFDADAAQITVLVLMFAVGAPQAE